MYRIKYVINGDATVILKQPYFSISAAAEALEKIKKENSHLENVEFFITYKIPGTKEWA